MPYVEGESLRQRLDRETQLPLDDALAITRQVAARWPTPTATTSCTAISKPENILLESAKRSSRTRHCAGDHGGGAATN